MDDFDKEFDNSPDAFDDEFEAAQPAESRLDSIMKSAGEYVSPVLDTAEDFSRGVASGLTMQGLDEAGGALGAAAERGLGMLGIGPAAVDAQLKAQGFSGSGVDESLTDTYKGYQEGISKELEASSERSPVMSTIGNIAGGITSGVALGGALGVGNQAKNTKSILDIAKQSGGGKAALELLKRGGVNYAKAAPALAVESALTSEADLVGSDANPLEVGKDVLGGLTFAAPLMLAGQAVSEVATPKAKDALGKVSDKLAQLAEESPLVRQAKIAYETYGQKAKINPRSEKAILEGVQAIEGGTPFSELNTKRASDITNKVLKADNELGKLVGQSLDDATSAGIRVSAQDLVQKALDEVTILSQELPGILQDANFNATMKKVLSRNYTNASPREIRNAMDDITNSIERISNSRYPSPELEQAPVILRKLRKELDTRLKDVVPQYRDSAERFSQFRRAYMEQPIAGRLDPNLDDIMYGDLKKGQKKLVEAYEELVSRTTADAQSAEDVEASFSKLSRATKDFQDKELDRLQQGKIKAPVLPGSKDFMKEIKDFADDSAVRRATRKTQETQGGAKVGIKDVTGLAQTGRGAVLTTSYLAGRATSSKPAQKLANMGRALYSAPAETLNGLAQKLEANPALSMYGKALREGLQNGDSAKKNAALFTIMQNPNARALVEAETGDETMDEE